MARRVDKVALGEFLRTRRAALRPVDVGTAGAGRAAVCKAYGERNLPVCATCRSITSPRLERGNGPQPSEQMVAAMARGLRLTPAERDHPLRPGRAPRTGPARGHRTHQSGSDAGRGSVGRHPRPGDGAAGGDSAADRTGRGPARARRRDTRASGGARGTDGSPIRPSASATPPTNTSWPAGSTWHFSEPPPPGTASPPRRRPLVDSLRAESSEFDRLWQRQEVGLQHSGTKGFSHPEVGRLDLFCQSLLDVETGQSLLIFTATPGTPSYDKLALLAVLGTDRFVAESES